MEGLVFFRLSLRFLIGVCSIFLITSSLELERILVAPNLGYAIIVALEYSPDGQFLAGSAGNPGGSGEGTLLLWDVQTGAVLREFRGQYETPFVTFTDFYDIAFSPDSRLIAASSDAGRTFVWDIQTGEQLFRFPSNRKPVAFSPDGRMLLMAFDNELILRDAETGLMINHAAEFREQVSAAVFSADGKTILAGDTSGMVILWNAARDFPLRTFNVGAPILSIALHPDGTQALIGSGSTDIYTGEGSAQVALWDMERAAEILVFDENLPLFNDILFVAFTPDGQLAAATIHNQALFWQSQTAVLAAQIPAAAQADYESFAFSPDATRAALGSAGGLIYLWRLPIE